MACVVLTRDQLPSALAYEDEINTFIAGQTFTTNLKINNGVAVATLGSLASAPRAINLPDVGGTLESQANKASPSGYPSLDASSVVQEAIYRVVSGTLVNRPAIGVSGQFYFVTDGGPRLTLWK